jgi:catechol 2,3-dioxygenase-like lactoylglutathione lyase family enzyme
VLDHLSLGVADLPRAVAFYDAALAPLGYVRLWAHERGAGYGPAGSEDEPLQLRAQPNARAPGPGWHLALAAPSRAAVDGFHAAALAAGGTDEGAPGLRPQYGPGYYAAFVRDLDGHRLEAVLHETVEPGIQ